MMRTQLLFTALTTVGLIHASAAPLFDAEDKTSYVIKPERAASAFTFDEGVLQVTGKPAGYIRTTKAYADYRLRLEWRWTAEPTNSGVLLHITDDAPKTRPWPTCIEAQLKHQSAGDLVLVGQGPALEVNGQPHAIAPDAERWWYVIPKAHPSNEKEPGEWNQYEITVKGDTIELRVNGEVQNTATRVNRSKGTIALQSEGSPIEFRNLTIEPLD